MWLGGNFFAKCHIMCIINGVGTPKFVTIPILGHRSFRFLVQLTYYHIPGITDI